MKATTHELILMERARHKERMKEGMEMGREISGGKTERECQRRNMFCFVRYYVYIFLCVNWERKAYY